jgi:hypothetical protein
MIDRGASREARAPEHEPVADGRRGPSAPADAVVGVGVPATGGQLEPDGLGPLLARAVAARAADRAEAAGDASAHAPEPVLLQRSPKTWTHAAATRTIAALTPGLALTSRWPAVQVLVARYGRLPPGGFEQREAMLGDIEHAMARWRSNQRGLFGMRVISNELEERKVAALDALASQIARERAEIVADKTRAAERADAAKAPPAAPPTASPVAQSAPIPAAELALPAPTDERHNAPVTDFWIGQIIGLLFDAGPDPYGELDNDYSRLILEAHRSGDRARMADLEAQIVAAGLEYHFKVPSNLHLTPTIDHPLLRPTERDAIPGFEMAESAAIDGKFRRKIYAAERSADPAAVKSLEKELEEAGLEHRYQRPGYPSALSGKSATGSAHPLGWVLLNEYRPRWPLGYAQNEADQPIHGFPAEESARVDGYFRRKIQTAATGSEATRRELDAELTEAGLEHRYYRTDSDEVDPEAKIHGQIGAPMTLFAPGGGEQLIPGFSPMDSARTDGYFRRRIRAAVSSGDEALKAAIDAELIDQGLEFRYIRGVRSHEPGQAPGADRRLDVSAYSPDHLSNPAGGDQARPLFHDAEPGAVSIYEPHPIPGLSAQETARLDGYFARMIRTATRTQNLEVREKLMADIDADLVERGIEHRYIRAADAHGKPLFYADEPAAGATIGTVRYIHGQPALIPGLTAQRSAETDVHFRRDIRRAVRSGKPVLVKHITAQLTAAGLTDRYSWD